MSCTRYRYWVLRVAITSTVGPKKLNNGPLCEWPWLWTRPPEGCHFIIFDPITDPIVTIAAESTHWFQYYLEWTESVGYLSFYVVWTTENLFWPTQHGVSCSLEFFLWSEDEERFLDEYSTFCFNFCMEVFPFYVIQAMKQFNGWLVAVDQCCGWRPSGGRVAIVPAQKGRLRGRDVTFF